MASSRRRKSLTVVQQLLDQPYRFQFFQAVRLLERVSVLNESSERFALEGVASGVLPNKEVLRFSSRQSLSFAASDISSIKARSAFQNGDSDTPDSQWEMEVCFMGLTGSQGVMPYYLSDLVLKELRQKNESLRDFLDVFNHRSISLYYQAWHKYQLPVNVERNRQRLNRRTDLFTDALNSIAGIGYQATAFHEPAAPDALAGMAGLLGRPVATAEGLKRLIKYHFCIDVDIEQFQGQWQELPVDMRCRLPGLECPNGVNNKLGVNTFLGQSKFRVVVAPLSNEKFDSLAPGSKKLEALKEFIRFAAGNELDFDISVTLSRNQVTPVKLSQNQKIDPLLGWNTHMNFEFNSDDEPYEITLTQDIDSPDESLPLAS